MIKLDSYYLWRNCLSITNIIYQFLYYRDIYFFTFCDWDALGNGKRYILKQMHNSMIDLDKWDAIRHFFEKFVQNCQKSYSVGNFLTINETLVKFYGRCAFKQHTLKKSAKYSMKLFAFVDFRLLYIWGVDLCWPAFQMT